MSNQESKIAIVVSKFNEQVTGKLLEGALSEAAKNGVEPKVVEVPGAVEIPLVAQRLAKLGYDAIVCLGAVIYGETDHYDYVCQQVSQGCQKVMLDHDVPVIFGILTTRTAQLALDRAGGKKGNKGAECFATAINMLDILKKIH